MLKFYVPLILWLIATCAVAVLSSSGLDSLLLAVLVAELNLVEVDCLGLLSCLVLTCRLARY